MLPEIMPFSPKMLQAANGTGHRDPAQGTNHCKGLRLASFVQRIGFNAVNSLDSMVLLAIIAILAALRQEKRSCVS
jgi:hypothetical protein